MSWAIAGDWLAVLGLAVLTFGTGAQAWANLAEFKSLRQSVSDAVNTAVNEAKREVIVTSLIGARLAADEYLRRGPLASFGRTSDARASVNRQFNRGIARYLRAQLARSSILSARIFMPGKLAELRAEGSGEAADMARYFRAAEIWIILMIGSALALAAACIQLALA